MIRNDLDLPADKHAMIVEAWAGITVEKAFTDALEREISDRRVKSRADLFSDRGQLMTAVMDSMMKLHVVREGTLGRRACHEVLRERLDQLPWPEFRFLAAHVLGEQLSAISFWKQAVENIPIEMAAEDQA